MSPILKRCSLLLHSHLHFTSPEIWLFPRTPAKKVVSPSLFLLCCVLIKMADKGKEPKASGGAGMTADAAKNWEGRLRTEYEAPHKWNEAWGELFNNGIPGEYGARAEFLSNELNNLPKTSLDYKDGSAFPKFGQVESRKQKFGWYDPLAPENQLPDMKD